jgi:hypothetical protein
MTALFSNYRMTAQDVERFESRIDKNGPEVERAEIISRYSEITGTRCHQWIAGRSSSGYGVFTVNVGEKVYSPLHIGAHAVAYTIYIGELKNQCCHKCDNRVCVNPLHLFDGTVKDNAIDRGAKGRGADQRGSSNPASVLTDDDVRYIRNNYQRTHRNLGNGTELASKFGISQALVSMIINRKRWAHVD